MTISVFIDGAAGTTGIEIAERLKSRDDLSLITLDDSRRKDASARREAINDADFTILCLPDDAAREAVSMVGNNSSRIIDASTAFRTDPDWTYGFPEFREGQFEAIRQARFVSNPGCYPTGFLGLVAPLIAKRLIPADWPLTVNAVSGYSGGGKAMIAAFEEPGNADTTDTAFRTYALGLSHKHVPEMHAHSGATYAPLFAPSVVRTYRGMVVDVPLVLEAMPGKPSADALEAALTEHYARSKIVSFHPRSETQEMGLLRVEDVGQSDRLKLHLFANEEGTQVRLVAMLDNLGKGASGAAVQSLNIMAGLDETAGLRL